MTKYCVLLSGGIDSATSLAYYINEYGVDNVFAVGVFYGQKHLKELNAANDLACYYSVPYYQLDLSSIFKYSYNPLMARSDKEISQKRAVDELNETGDVSVVIPFRNGAIISSVTAFALTLYPEDGITIVVSTFTDPKLNVAPFPDCSSTFSQAIDVAIQHGTRNQVELEFPWQGDVKKDIVYEGLKLGVPYELTWSCYLGDDEACGKCHTCIDRKQAFLINGTEDPIKYK